MQFGYKIYSELRAREYLATCEGGKTCLKFGRYTCHQSQRGCLGLGTLVAVDICMKTLTVSKITLKQLNQLQDLGYTVVLTNRKASK